MKYFCFLILLIASVSTLKAQQKNTASEPKMELSVVCLLVHNYDEALTFYTQKLGFKVSQDMKYGPNNRWVTVKPNENAAIELSLGLATTEADKQLVGKQGGQFPFLVLTTTKLEADFNRMKEKGVTVVSEPKKNPWGTTASVKDLYGNVILIKSN